MSMSMSMSMSLSMSMSMSTLSSSTFPNSSISQRQAVLNLPKQFPFPESVSLSPAWRRRILCKSSEAEVEDEWLQKLPEKTKPLYSHSLPCIEAWLRSLGFSQAKDDRALWLAHNPNWHAHLSLDVTDLYIRYLKSGPGNLEKDVERRFSYALSREDIENAVLGGP